MKTNPKTAQRVPATRHTRLRVMEEEGRRQPSPTRCRDGASQGGPLLSDEVRQAFRFWIAQWTRREAESGDLIAVTALELKSPARPPAVCDGAVRNRWRYTPNGWAASALTPTSHPLDRADRPWRRTGDLARPCGPIGYSPVLHRPADDEAMARTSGQAALAIMSALGLIATALGASSADPRSNQWSRRILSAARPIRPRRLMAR
jgi:hypothetical protein